MRMRMRPDRWTPAGRPEDAALPVDFIASREHFLDHLAPVWRELENRGRFCVPYELAGHAESLGVEPSAFESFREGTGPVAVAAYGDLRRVRDDRHIILFEHGAGFSFSNAHASYAGGSHERRRVSLFCEVNDWTARRNRARFPGCRSHIVGCPKLDALTESGPRKRKGGQVVCISFHWDCRVAPETRSALPHYRDVLPEIVRKFNVILHGHPRTAWETSKLAESLGVEYVPRFEDVCRRADVYVNDASSTLYEFAAVAGPVVVLNAPWYRRKVNHGLRFWKCSEVGPHVDEPGQLAVAITGALCEDDLQRQVRDDVTSEVYPYLGRSAERAAHVVNSLPGLVRGERLYPAVPDHLPAGCAVLAPDELTAHDVARWHGEAALSVDGAEYVAHLAPGVRLSGSLEPAFRPLMQGWDCVAFALPYSHRAASAPRLKTWDKRAFFSRGGARPGNGRTWILDSSFGLEMPS